MSIKKLFAALLLAPALAFAWEPTKPVTVYIGNTPGAGNEMAFRKLADIVQKSNPKFVYVVQNIPGADSVIANNRFLEAANDGYTINLPSHMSSYVTNDIWEKSIKKYNYDSFVDVLTMGKSPLVLVAHPSSSVNTPQDFVRLISTATRPVNVALGGGAHRTAYEYLMDRGRGNKQQVQPIKFNGPMPALFSVASFDPKLGGTEFGIMPIAIAKPLIDAGRVKPIAITSEQRLSKIPKVPLWKDYVPGLNVYAAWMIMLPPGTPREQIDYYNKLFVPAINSAESLKLFEENLMFTVRSEQTTEGARAYISRLQTQWIPYTRKITPN